MTLESYTLKTLESSILTALERGTLTTLESAIAVSGHEEDPLEKVTRLGSAVDLSHSGSETQEHG